MRLGPSEAEAQTETSLARRCVLRARVVRDVQAGNSDCARSASHIHQLIEYDRGLFDTALTFCLEAHAVDRAVHFAHADDLLDLISQRAAQIQVDRLASE